LLGLPIQRFDIIFHNLHQELRKKEGGNDRNHDEEKDNYSRAESWQRNSLNSE